MRRAGPIALAAALVASWAMPAWAEVRVLSVEFDPPRYVSGDRVVAYVLWDDAGIAWFPETLSAGFPEPAQGGPTLSSARLEARAGRPSLVVAFTPWRPGQATLPPLTVGGVSFPPIPVDAASALAGDEGYAPQPLPQLEPEGVRARVYAMTGGLLALAALAALAALKVLPWLRTLARAWAIKRARREFVGMLDYLAEAGEAGPDAWALLCSGLRRYLCARSDRDFLALTPGEVSELARAAPAETPALPAGALAEAAAILGRGDMVRFAGRPGEGLQGALADSRSLADRIEEAFGQAARDAKRRRP